MSLDFKTIVILISIINDICHNHLRPSSQQYLTIPNNFYGQTTSNADIYIKIICSSLLRKHSYEFVTQSFRPHERLLQPVATSVRANWPITGRLPIFVKRDFDPKLISRVHVNIANVAAVFDLVSQKFCIRELNALQKEAIIQFVEKQRDVFINLPTGFGKSFIYQALPLVFDAMHGEGHIVVVVSPLVSLMKDQVQKLRNLGISAVTLSDIEEEDAKAVEKGFFSVVYGSPEAFLKEKVTPEIEFFLSSPIKSLY